MNSATPNRDEPMVLAAKTREVSSEPDAEEIASAVDPVHSTHSSGREKVLEHIFLGDLLRALWRMGVHDVQVLRPEVDRNGYEFMLGHERIRRSVQLKTSYRGGKANEVTVNRHLKNEPSGCVIWMMFDKETLELGPFLWLGGPPGEAMPELGDKVGRHTKCDRNGIKAERPNTRVVPKSRFRRLATIEEVAAALFGWLGAATMTPGREAAHRATLLRHLRANARSSPLPDDGDREWLEQARCGEFSSMPEEFDWDRSTFFAHLIDGYRLALQEGLGDLQDFYWTSLAEAERTGIWSGTTLELWLALFAANRAIRHGGHEPGDEYRRRLDGLCRALRSGLAS
jgi:hypothetical protein